MNTIIRTAFSLSLLALLFPLSFAMAQQLRLVESSPTEIETDTYRAYYGQLTGEPHTFTFHAEDEIEPVMFVLLVPDVEGAETDISIAMTDALHPEEPFTSADGALIEWQRFFDTAGRDSYLAGPTLQATVPRGDYSIRISSPDNIGAYVLVVSGEEPFAPGEVLRRFSTVPDIKSEFFGKPGYQAYLTPLLLWPLIGVLFILGLVVLVILVLRRRTLAR